MLKSKKVKTSRIKVVKPERKKVQHKVLLLKEKRGIKLKSSLPKFPIKNAINLLVNSLKLHIIEHTQNSILVAFLRTVTITENICNGAGFQPLDKESEQEFVVFYHIVLNPNVNLIGEFGKKLTMIKVPELVYTPTLENLSEWINSL